MRLILQQQVQGKMDREEVLLEYYGKEQGIEVITGSLKQVLRKKLVLEEEDVPFGDWPFIRACMQQLGIPAPEHTPYPASLSPWLHRGVWKQPSVYTALQGRLPIFIKPAEGWKRFTGFVADHDRPIQLQGISMRQPVWCSEPIQIVSEWRAYVVGAEVLDVKFADHGGDSSVEPDFDVIKSAVAEFHQAGEAPAGYVIDFGVDVQGRTVLIEVNDGFSFGAYGDVTGETIWRIAVARWNELLATRVQADT